MEVGVCHTVPMPGGQAPFQDVEVGVCHTVPMPGGQTPFQDVEIGICHTVPMPGSQTPFQDVEVGVCHTAPMPSGQTPFQDVEVGVYHMAPMPGGQPIIPSCGLGVSETIPRTLGVELGTIMSDGLLPSQSVSVGASHKASMEVSVEAGRPTVVPGGSGLGQCLSAPMPVGHPLSTEQSYEDEEEDVAPNQVGVSPFLHLIGQVRDHLHLPAPKAPSLSHLTGVERAQGSVLSSNPFFSFPRLLMAQAVREEAQCRSLKEFKPCSANFQLSRDWYGRARSFYLPEETSLDPPPVNEELGGLMAGGQPGGLCILPPVGANGENVWLTLPLGQTRCWLLGLVLL
ncbi:hypothetical protein E2C01_052362 [Portunus trituberculatus]|uniref:Uncharacterized protein n=1 Tax=Portunus trituberculatus TaxID=210409 RepID=A0A5B7GDH2_PORTR|nr:hypothetical protein [Portunus trituberculatus]